MPFAVANPNFFHGKLSRVYLAQMDASPYLNEAEVSQEIETHESSSFGTTAKTYIPGQRDATMSIGGMYDGSPDAFDELMNNLHLQDNTYPVTLVYGNPTAGRTARLASVMQTSYDVSSPASDLVTISGELQTNAGAKFGYILNGTASIDSTVVTGTAVDGGAASATTAGGTMHVHVLSNTRTSTTEVKVQTSTDNSVWVDLLTQTVPVGGPTTAGYSVNVPTGAVNRYIRTLITPAAGTGSAVIIVAFGRN